MVTEVLVSHSESDAFARCEQQHYFAHEEKLAPVKLSEALDRGTRNHTVMETYYNALMVGKSWEDAKSLAYDTLTGMVLEPDVNMTLLNQLVETIPFFFDADKDRVNAGWKVLAVEKEFRIKFPVTAMADGSEIQITYPFKVDLIRQDPVGNNYVVDTKTVYNFYTAMDIALMPQVPKYIGALRYLDMPVKGGIMSMIRWRKIKESSIANKHQWYEIPLTDTKIINFWLQHLKQVHRIALYKLHPDTWESDITRTLSQMVCKNCAFKILCDMELSGLDTTLTKKIEYVPNTYGYQSDLVLEAD